MKTQLLCTFSTKDRLEVIVGLIIECNEILYDKVYVFQNLTEVNQMICTYNVTYEDDYVAEDIPNTISLHRKKNTNTLYSINALNEVIRSLNNGVLDKKFPVPWENYQNSLLLTNEAGLNKIPTKLYKIIDTKNFDKI
jgi:hypothetical protein